MSVFAGAFGAAAQKEAGGNVASLAYSTAAPGGPVHDGSAYKQHDYFGVLAMHLVLN